MALNIMLSLLQFDQILHSTLDCICSIIKILLESPANINANQAINMLIRLSDCVTWCTTKAMKGMIIHGNT